MRAEDQVRELINKYFWGMDDNCSLSTGRDCVLPEDASDFFKEYFSELNIDSDNFKFNKYFPNEGIWFLPNAILPDYLKTDHHQASPLTVQMLMESAKAGRWLYD